jgi:hypothetical protein
LGSEEELPLKYLDPLANAFLYIWRRANGASHDSSQKVKPIRLHKNFVVFGVVPLASGLDACTFSATASSRRSTIADNIKEATACENRLDELIKHDGLGGGGTNVNAFRDDPNAVRADSCGLRQASDAKRCPVLNTQPWNFDANGLALGKSCRVHAGY